MNLFALILVGIAAVIGVVLVLIMANFFGVWLRAKIADAPVAFAKLIGMRLRRVPWASLKPYYGGGLARRWIPIL
jgi:uncharacterized protein YqfA (UPF0365 family)